MSSNQTMSLLPAELFFSMGRLAAIFSLLFILVLVLVIIFFLVYQQRNSTHFDEHELRSETDQSVVENSSLRSGKFKRYASTNSDSHEHSMTKTTSMDASNSEFNERKTQSTTNLIASN